MPERFVSLAEVMTVFFMGYWLVNAGTRIIRRVLTKDDDPEIETLIDRIMALPAEDRAELREIVEQKIIENAWAARKDAADRP